VISSLSLDAEAGRLKARVTALPLSMPGWPLGRDAAGRVPHRNAPGQPPRSLAIVREHPPDAGSPTAMARNTAVHSLRANRCRVLLVSNTSTREEWSSGRALNE
jgi:hypothetical protein